MKSTDEFKKFPRGKITESHSNLGAKSFTSPPKWLQCLAFSVLEKYVTFWVLRVFWSFDISLYFQIFNKKCTISMKNSVEKN